MARIKNITELPDDEFRVIGAHEPGAAGKKKLSLWWWIAVTVAAIALALLLLVLPKSKAKPDGGETGVFEGSNAAWSVKVEPLVEPFGSPVDTAAGPYVEKIQETVNDIVFDIYIPNNCTPVLSVGNPTAELRKGLLAFQAADIRADNRKILGAFVLKGEPLAWGLSKKGYCAIIDGKITVGVSENSPLFEEATEKGGYFFRQYPMVDNGTLCESELKGKSVRKAICDRAGQIFVAVTTTEESMHDFAQALVDMGVKNAVYLVGSRYSFGWWRQTPDDEPELFGLDDHHESYKNETYIIWMKE